MLLAVCPRVQAETANRVVAVVNDEIVTQADVASRMDTILAESHIDQPTAVESVELERMALRSLIEQQLMLQEARRLELAVANHEIVERLEAIQERFGSDEAFQAWLTKEGLSAPQLKERIQQQLLVQRVIDAKVRSTIMVSPQEVSREVQVHPEQARLGDRVRALHILVRVTEDRSEAKARERIEQLHQQLLHGAGFAELAKRYSEDAHAEASGAMGWVAQGELLPELDAVLFGLKVGELSVPVQTRLGFHLVRVEERQTAGNLSVTEAHQAVLERIYQQKFQQAFDRWLAELKRRAYIELVLEQGDEGG
jgi:peptidyl-prolyl cis-trans isomerase SurA